MRVLLVPNIFFPDPPGGTEVGVLELSKALRRSGIDASVAAPHWGGHFVERYEWEGVPVWRYRVTENSLHAGALDIEDTDQSRNFELMIKKSGAQLISLHAWTSAVGVNQIKAARRLSIPVMATCHLANVVCPRGSGMLWGKIPCDLRVSHSRCAACLLQSKGLPILFSRFLSRLAGVMKMNGLDKKRCAFTRLLRLPTRIRELLEHRNHLHQQIALFVVQSPWFQRVLLENGIPAGKINIAPSCLYRKPLDVARLDEIAALRGDGELVFGFIGRLSRAKGVDLFVKAIQRLPPLNMKVEARIFGIVQSGEEIAFQELISALASRDQRIRLMKPLQGNQVLPELTRCDLICVPSRVQDMRPQVVLEAFSVKVPIIGANCGGISDLVRHEVNGLLFRPGDVSSLRAALLRIVLEPRLLGYFRKNIPRVRGIESLEEFMLNKFQQLLGLDHLDLGCTP